MPIAVWNDRFATGLASIDLQHQELFAAVNRLEEASTGRDSETEVRKALAFLLQYTVEHFRVEEDHMERHGYPGFAAHAVEHARLMDQVGVLQRRFDAGRPMAAELTVFFADWLKHHIHQVDQAYAAFLKARGVS